MKERTEGYRYQDGSYGASGGSYGGFGNGGFGSFGDFGSFGGAFSGSRTGYEEDGHLRAAGNYVRMDIIRKQEPYLTVWRRAAETPDGTITVHWHMQALEIRHLHWNMPEDAAALEPGNQDYSNLVYQFENGGTWYRQRQYTYGQPYTGGSGFCLKLCIVNMLCNLC